MFVGEKCTLVPRNCNAISDCQVNEGHRNDLGQYTYAQALLSPLQAAASKYFSWSREHRAVEILDTLGILFNRNNSDDLLYTMLVVINEYVTKVRRPVKSFFLVHQPLQKI